MLYLYQPKLRTETKRITTTKDTLDHNPTTSSLSRMVHRHSVSFVDSLVWIVDHGWRVAMKEKRMCVMVDTDSHLASHVRM